MQKITWINVKQGELINSNQIQFKKKTETYVDTLGSMRCLVNVSTFRQPLRILHQSLRSNHQKTRPLIKQQIALSFVHDCNTFLAESQMYSLWALAHLQLTGVMYPLLFLMSIMTHGPDQRPQFEPRDKDRCGACLDLQLAPLLNHVFLMNYQMCKFDDIIWPMSKISKTYNVMYVYIN